jgi:hypothetical protein
MHSWHVAPDKQLAEAPTGVSGMASVGARRRAATPRRASSPPRLIHHHTPSLVRARARTARSRAARWRGAHGGGARGAPRNGSCAPARRAAPPRSEARARASRRGSSALPRRRARPGWLRLSRAQRRDACTHASWRLCGTPGAPGAAAVRTRAACAWRTARAPHHHHAAQPPPLMRRSCARRRASLCSALGADARAPPLCARRKRSTTRCPPHPCSALSAWPSAAGC